MLRVLLLAFMFLALTGCWVGRDLYSPIDARPAIPAGVYRATGGDTPARVYRVSILPNGLTQFDGGEKKEVYGFAPLGRDTYVGWAQIEDAGPEDEVNQLYGLVVRQADGRFMIYAPECKDEQARDRAQERRYDRKRFFSGVPLHDTNRAGKGDATDAAQICRRAAPGTHPIVNQ